MSKSYTVREFNFCVKNAANEVFLLTEGSVGASVALTENLSKIGCSVEVDRSDMTGTVFLKYIK